MLGGIVEYVKGRISEDAGDQVAFTLADTLAFTTNPEMRSILEEACWFCWEAYRKDYSPSAAVDVAARVDTHIVKYVVSISY